MNIGLKLVGYKKYFICFNVQFKGNLTQGKLTLNLKKRLLKLSYVKNGKVAWPLNKQPWKLNHA